jgi:pyoverdine/dityrosine biosynthesis protein Dit1
MQLVKPYALSGAKPSKVCYNYITKFRIISKRMLHMILRSIASDTFLQIFPQGIRMSVRYTSTRMKNLSTGMEIPKYHEILKTNMNIFTFSLN